MTFTAAIDLSDVVAAPRASFSLLILQGAQLSYDMVGDHISLQPLILHLQPAVLSSKRGHNAGSPLQQSLSPP